MLVAIMALAETRTPGSRHAVRPGSVVLMALALAALAYEMFAGPGLLGGVTAMRTGWFWLACAGAAGLFLICAERQRALLPAAPDQSSSGPPR
jgi:hypothetical protein